MKFEKYAVAFLDILGFSKFVEEAEIDQGKASCLKNLFEIVIPRAVEDDPAAKLSKVPMPKTLSFSDSLIVTAPISGECSFGMISVSIKAIQIAHSLLEMGFLIRGAISVGNANVADAHVIGTSYQEAVAGEKKATYPRIILTDSAEKFLNESLEKGMVRYSIYSKDQDGVVFLNSIFPHKAYLPSSDVCFADQYGKYKVVIEENIGKTSGSVKEKWLWFSRLFNANVKYFSWLSDNSPIEVDECGGIVNNYLNPPPLDFAWMEPFRAKVIVGRVNDLDESCL